jgi:hypothetical protein
VIRIIRDKKIPVPKIFATPVKIFRRKREEAQNKKGQFNYEKRRYHHHGYSVFARPSLGRPHGSLIQGDMAGTYGRPQQETKTNNMKSMLRFLGLPSVKASLR